MTAMPRQPARVCFAGGGNHRFREIKGGDLSLLVFAAQQAGEVTSAATDIENAFGINFGEIKVSKQSVTDLTLQNGMFIVAV